MPRIEHPIQQEELMAYLDGELPLDRARVAVEHLESCRECQGFAADMESVSRKLMEWQVEDVGQKLAPELAAATSPPYRRSRWSSRWVLGVACAGLVALMLISLPKLTTHRREMYWVDAVRTHQASEGVSSFMISPAPMIARTAQLTLTTSEFDKARTGLEDILKRHNGFVGQLSVNAPAGAGRTLDATLRIPSDQRDAAIADVKKLGRVESESQTGEEVTAQYVDLEARLSNAQNTEQRLTEMLRQRTGKLSDVLDVEKEISRVRGEIEQMQAEKKNLTNRVAFLSLAVKISEDYRAQLQLSPDSVAGRLRNAAVRGYRSMADGVVSVILFLLARGPSILIWGAVLFFPARLVWKRLRRT